MRILLTKLFIIYAELNILFSQIEFVLFILLTGLRTCPILFTEQSSFLHLLIKSGFYSPVIYDSRVIEIIHTPLIDELAVNEDSAVGFGEDDRSNLKVNDYWHIVQDHLGKWHIGLVFEVTDHENDIVLVVDVLVSASLFYRFPMISAKTYLIEVAEEYENCVILAADLHHNICGSSDQMGNIYDLPDLPLIIKTRWICIIQRTWRRIYQRRLKLRGSLKAQRQFELSGGYGFIGVGLRGMLSSSNTGTPGMAPSSNTGTPGMAPSSISETSNIKIG